MCNPDRWSTEDYLYMSTVNEGKRKKFDPLTAAVNFVILLFLAAVFVCMIILFANGLPPVGV